MDVLRKELNSIYESQSLDGEVLDAAEIEHCKALVAVAVSVDDGCRVVTDASADRCWIFGGRLADFIGLSGGMFLEVDSSDEDEIYNRIHPEDLVDKRMLEYEFFRYVDTLSPEKKPEKKATCRIRVRNRDGVYVYLNNSTQVFRLSPAGKMWLILCCYSLASDQGIKDGIDPCIIDISTGAVTCPEIAEKRSRLLTAREKEVLTLVKEGKPSKSIADILGISVHTVNRHRQNILEKLSVGNSCEAVMAATAMKLL